MEIDDEIPVAENKSEVNKKAESHLGYTQFNTRYDSETSTIWCWMHPEPRPCLNATLIDELVNLQKQLTHTYKTQHPDTIWPFRHLILASKLPGIYNLGGAVQRLYNQ